LKSAWRFDIKADLPKTSKGMTSWGNHILHTADVVAAATNPLDGIRFEGRVVGLGFEEAME
jgi:hypothetical protein